MAGASAGRASSVPPPFAPAPPLASLPVIPPVPTPPTPPRPPPMVPAAGLPPLAPPTASPPLPPVDPPAPPPDEPLSSVSAHCLGPRQPATETAMTPIRQYRMKLRILEHQAARATNSGDRGSTGNRPASCSPFSRWVMQEQGRGPGGQQAPGHVSDDGESLGAVHVVVQTCALVPTAVVVLNTAVFPAVTGGHTSVIERRCGVIVEFVPPADPHDRSHHPDSHCSRGRTSGQPGHCPDT
jgi:hypothetical protein